MRIDSVEQLGAVMRETRVALNIPLQDLAEAAGTSHTLLRRQEHGQATKALQVLFAAMKELGIEMHVELPSVVNPNTLDLSPGAKRNKRARP